MVSINAYELNSLYYIFLIFESHLLAAYNDGYSGGEKSEIHAKRWILLLLGIQFLAIGIVCNTRTNLGVAAFTSVFYAISQIYGISLGIASILMYIVLIVIQICLLRKIPLAVVLQIPFSLVFGVVTDLYDRVIPFHSLTLI